MKISRPCLSLVVLCFSASPAFATTSNGIRAAPHGAIELDMDGTVGRNLAECKTMNVYRDQRDFDDDTYKAFRAPCSGKPDKPGTTVAVSLPLYSKKDRKGEKIGMFEETWINTFDGDGIGSFALNLEEGQIISHWTMDCAGAYNENAIVAGTGKYRGIEGYVTFHQSGDFSKKEGFSNKMKVYYDC